MSEQLTDPLPETETCQWVEDDDGVYFGACGIAWEFLAGTPADNKCWYCMRCGKRIEAPPC